MLFAATGYAKSNDLCDGTLPRVPVPRKQRDVVGGGVGGIDGHDRGQREDARRGHFYFTFWGAESS
jgi:hypothetical protein